jgi:hypothetical protein
MDDLVVSNPYAAFQKVAGEEIGGRILKFTKEAKWTVGVEEENFDGATMLVDLAGLMVGWRKWRDAKIVASDIGYVASGFQPKSRAELDDVEESSWPKNSRSEASDPWQYGYFVRMSDEDGGVYVWTAASAGAKRAIGTLCGQFARKRVNPIVKLSASSYRHQAYGKINVPALQVVAWSDAEPDKPALTDKRRNPTPADLDDSIPF